MVTWPSTRRPEARCCPAGLSFSAARSRARRSSMLQIASYSSFTADSVVGKCPRFLVILRSWKFSDSIEFVV